MWSWDIILALLAVGSAAGFIAGLFGVGGGTLVAPVVLWALQLQGVGTTPLCPASRHRHFLCRRGVYRTFSSMYAQHKTRHRLGNRPPMTPHDTRRPRRSNGKIYADAGFAGFLLLHFYPLSHSKPYAIPNPRLHAPPSLPPRPDSRRHAFLSSSSWVGIGGGSLSVPFLLY